MAFPKTPATQRIARVALGTVAGGIVLSGIAAPMAVAAPDCSPASVETTSNSAMAQVQTYMATHPDGNKVLMTAALQPRPQAAATLAAYANSNPGEYAEFKSILAPLKVLQNQCGVQVVPTQFQWAFDQFS